MNHHNNNRNDNNNTTTIVVADLMLTSSCFGHIPPQEYTRRHRAAKGALPASLDGELAGIAR